MLRSLAKKGRLCSLDPANEIAMKLKSAGSSGKSEHLVFQRHENTQTSPSCLGLAIIYDPNNRGQAKAPILRPLRAGP